MESDDELLQKIVRNLKGECELSEEEQQAIFDRVLDWALFQLTEYGIASEDVDAIQDEIIRNGFRIALDSKDRPCIVIGMTFETISPDEIAEQGVVVYHLDSDSTDEGEQDE